jgi:hypothetical protein
LIACLPRERSAYQRELCECIARAVDARQRLGVLNAIGRRDECRLGEGVLNALTAGWGPDLRRWARTCLCRRPGISGGSRAVFDLPIHCARE